ncbi:proteophosphoglycan 5 [Fusarium austroafricanum]|uniref:Proteophosphoglycan 5 n=1 Tax=Fusarium austroafricanum TaxID=2364996 RepID=A0A8H4NKF4_9HYPO|nr:proteophosphoglycan 5 [Fusarium austroafricanum]
MSETPSQPTTTPALRRNGRGNGRPAAQKAYASENDVATIDPARYDRAPRTPQKGHGTDSPNAQLSHTNSKQRPRNGNNNNKHRGKNGPHSPESARPGRHTPPHQSSSIKPVSAFAGATFHASPAPSALPLPSFVSRPATESPSVNKTSRDIIQEPSPPTDTEAPTPLRQSAPAVQESPLDFMFRAHRQEKERQRSESTSSFRPSGPVNESPSGQSPFGPGTIPKPATLPQTARTQTRFQSGGIGTAELDGTPGRPLGPAFSTPYQERIKAARSNSARSPADLTAHQSTPNPEAEDPTEALKKFLFNGNGTNASQSVPNGFAPAPPTQHYNHPRSGPSVPAPYEGRSNNLQAMENDLRRILKLDLSTGSPSGDQRLFS